MFYIYDENTKEFLFEEESYLDPVASQRLQKDVYLVPKNSTDVKPLEPKDNCKIIFDVGTNSWKYEEIVVTKEESTLTLAEQKTNKLDELNNLFNLYTGVCSEVYCVCSNGLKVNADSRSINNISYLITKMEYEKLSSISFRDFDNNYSDVSLEDLTKMKSEMEINNISLYEQKWSLEKDINDAKTTKALNKIEIKFEFKSFVDTIES